MDRLSKVGRSLLMSRVRTKDTSAEIKARSIVHGLGFRFRLHRGDLPGKPDLVFSSRKKVIFVHGCFWHGHCCPRGKLPTTNISFWRKKIRTNRLRDTRNIRSLRSLGWNSHVVWECELTNSKIATSLRRFLSD